MRKTTIAILALLTGCFGASGQNIPTGKSVLGIGVNSCSYSSAATNLCTLNRAAGGLAGIDIFANYNYGVLTHITLAAEGGFASYAAASGYEIGVGTEYDFKLTHKNRDPFDIYIDAHGGYTHLNYKGGIITIDGKFVGPGIYYGAGFGVRKHIGINWGLFVDANYMIYHYNGGEVIATDKEKTPYTVNFSGFNFGGGIYFMFGKTHHALVD